MNEALNNLLTRRSCRAYKPEQVKTEDLDAILEAGTYAATGMGKQSPLIVAIQDPETVKQVERLNAGVMGNPDGHTFYGAPTVVVVFGHSDSALELADANLVIGNLLNAANAVGVDSCYIWRARESFDSEEGQALKKAWGIPEEYIGVGNVILGYGTPEGKRPAAPRKEDYIRKV
ncbi:MAG: nitroreductase family protein [Clostridia bacterium]|nr:nitroreductase family protein [Clostridia bacterium]